VLETVVVGKVNGSNDSIGLTARADLESHLTGRLITATTAFDLDRVDRLVGFELDAGINESTARKCSDATVPGLECLVMYHGSSILEVRYSITLEAVLMNTAAK